MLYIIQKRERKKASAIKKMTQRNTQRQNEKETQGDKGTENNEQAERKTEKENWCDWGPQ